MKRLNLNPKLPLAAVVLAAAFSRADAQSTFQLSEQLNVSGAPAGILATWGTSAQCHYLESTGGDDVSRLPYVLTEQWLSRGMFYCLVSWRAHRDEKNAQTAHALLQCGEDAVRDYDAVFIVENDHLRIRWSDDFTTQPLRRCQ